MTEQMTTWAQYLASKWGVDVNADSNQESELTVVYKAIGRDAFDECVNIVADANEPSRTVRYLLGVIRRRQKESAIKTPAKTKAAAIGAYVYHRCSKCLFVNKIRRDVLEQHKGKQMRCGGVCHQQWLVDDILKQYEKVNNHD